VGTPSTRIAGGGVSAVAEGAAAVEAAAVGAAAGGAVVGVAVGVVQAAQTKIAARAAIRVGNADEERLGEGLFMPAC
jgi:hypothetical protein